MSESGNFRKALEDAVSERHCANHPMTEKWAAGRLGRGDGAHRSALNGW